MATFVDGSSRQLNDFGLDAPVTEAEPAEAAQRTLAGRGCSGGCTGLISPGGCGERPFHDVLMWLTLLGGLGLSVTGA